MRAISGLLVGLFVSMLSTTIVTNALPTIMADLHGSATGYTWVVTAHLLAMTASMPIWGKLADLVDKKRLVQSALGVFVLGSVLAGLAGSPGMLIACRFVQGVGGGGMSALVQVAMGAIIPARDRGRYNGYVGATFAVATVTGPLVGGLVVDAPWLGWRWCFYLSLPIAALAGVLIQRTLRLPVGTREVSIDYAGALLISGGACCLLIWVSLAGGAFGWASAQTGWLVGGGVLLLAVAVAVEFRVREPMIPPRLFRDRTLVLCVVAAFCIGTVMFSTPVMLSQYFQLGQGRSPVISGLLAVPLVGAMAYASLHVGRVISRSGRWKRFLVLGCGLVLAGLLLLGLVGPTTTPVLVGLAMVPVGLGLGLVQQNVIVIAQNTAPLADLGAASATVQFIRSLGGTTGVAVLGALIAHRITDLTAAGLAADGLPVDALGDGRDIPDLDALGPPVASVVRHAYGTAVPEAFLSAIPLVVVAAVVILLIVETPLRTTVRVEPTADPAPR
ncbi:MULTISPECIES: MFS transporter [Frankia]|uniref:Membrane transport protein n=2 Tax=Frankia TaxID=1854 RepID=Q0RIH8_FRAAA|nr:MULTISPECIES: MFS transporter [Frankia]CAJ62691.1 putative membrane transport protein [Frankia alni ACN14a]